MYNKLERVCLGFEAILLSRKDESYNEIIDFVIDCSSLRSKNKFYIVAADGAISQLLESYLIILLLPVGILLDEWRW